MEEGASEREEVIDLRSDAQSRPTRGMLEAVLSAPLGDDTFGEDPTARRLEEAVAERLGTEAALLVLSGTMANVLALVTHCRPGDEIFSDADAHVVRSEAGGLGALAGVVSTTVLAERGHMLPEALSLAIRERAVFRPRPRLVWLENTHNRGGGSLLGSARQAALVSVARDHGLAVHLDGARLFNAAAAMGRDLARLTVGVDSVSLDFTKGLACAAGAVLAGGAGFIEDARRWRRIVGGGMRQAGFIAAPCLIALDTMVERLAEDHATARALADGLASVPGFGLDPRAVETNIVIAQVARLGGAGRLVERLRGSGVLVGAVSRDEVRLVTHRHVGMRELSIALERIREAATALLGSAERR